MHIKLRTVVLVFPIIIAVYVSSYVNSIRERRADAVAAYQSGHHHSPSMMLSVFGRDECSRQMCRLADSTPDVVFDVSDRWVKIIRTPQRFGLGNGEGILVFSLIDGSSRYEMLPAGGVIEDMTFTDNSLIVRAYGYFDHGSSAYKVPRESPMEIRLQWPAGAPPASTRIAKLAMDEYMKWYRVK